MKVHILDPREVVPHCQADGKYLRAYRQIVRDAQEDAVGRHPLASNASTADLILAPVNDNAYGPFFERLKASRYVRAGAPLVVYCPDDKRLPSLPGLYPSCTPFWRRLGLALPAHYRSDHLPRHDFRPDEITSKDVLTSFVGAFGSHPVRRQIAEIGLRDSIIREASPDGRFWWDRSLEEQEEIKRSYRTVLARTRFALCPRGVSAASIRIYEAMEARAVPIIIADEIELPSGPDWASFSIRVPLKAINDLPEVIARHEPRSEEMGAQARAAWTKYFSPQASYHSLVEWSQELIAKGASSFLRPPRLAADIASFVAPRHIRQRLGVLKRSLLARVRQQA